MNIVFPPGEYKCKEGVLAVTALIGETKINITKRLQMRRRPRKNTNETRGLFF